MRTSILQFEKRMTASIGNWAKDISVFLSFAWKFGRRFWWLLGALGILYWLSKYGTAWWTIQYQMHVHASEVPGDVWHRMDDGSLPVLFTLLGYFDYFWRILLLGYLVELLARRAGTEEGWQYFRWKSVLIAACTIICVEHIPTLVYSVVFAITPAFKHAPLMVLDAMYAGILLFKFVIIISAVQNSLSTFIPEAFRLMRRHWHISLFLFLYAAFPSHWLVFMIDYEYSWLISVLLQLKQGVFPILGVWLFLSVIFLHKDKVTESTTSL